MLSELMPLYWGLATRIFVLVSTWSLSGSVQSFLGWDCFSKSISVWSQFPWKVPHGPGPPTCYFPIFSNTSCSMCSWWRVMARATTCFMIQYYCRVFLNSDCLPFIFPASYNIPSHSSMGMSLHLRLSLKSRSQIQIWSLTSFVFPSMYESMIIFMWSPLGFLPLFFP